MNAINFGDGRLPNRFWSRAIPEPNSGCWLWTGPSTSNGYGLVWAGAAVGRNVLSHRMAYEALVGPIPEGLHIDHLCRTPFCCNPAHMEPVTQGENNRRAPTFGAYKTHCPAGHEYTAENTRVSSKNNGRFCIACDRANGLRRSLDRHNQRKAAGLPTRRLRAVR